MTWAGPTWAQWNDTVRSLEATRDVANQNYENAEQWKAYAKSLETQVQSLQATLQQWKGWYEDAASSEYAYSKLKDALVEELKVAAPSNRLLDQGERQKLFDEKKAWGLEDLRKKHAATVA